MRPSVFKTYDIRGKAEEDFKTPNTVRLGKAFGTYFLQRGFKKVIVGRDNRLTSPRLREAVIEGLLSCGCNVVDIGETITPVFYFAHKKLSVAAGVMITASHNPPEDNGFKIYSGESTIYGDEIQEVRRIYEGGEFVSGDGVVTETNIRDDYLHYIASKIQLKKRIKLVVDCGNGTAGPWVPALYTKLGCEVVSLYCESDPTFPNHHPDPTVTQNLETLRYKVLEEKADVGLSFDGDGDRLGVIDDKGNTIWGDILQILFWREIMPKYPGADAIVEVKCSQALVHEIRKLGGNPFFYKTGHSLIKAKMKEIGAVFTGEMSGHIFFADEYFGFDDALYAGARLLRVLSKSEEPLSHLLSDVPKYYSTPETRIGCKEEAKEEIIQRLKESFLNKGYDLIDIDGLRVQFPCGWGLIRASNTQPVLVARCEGNSLAALLEIAAEIKYSLTNITEVDPFEWEIPYSS